MTDEALIRWVAKARIGDPLPAGESLRSIGRAFKRAGLPVPPTGSTGREVAEQLKLEACRHLRYPIEQTETTRSSRDYEFPPAH